jgi:transglutaminase-like putative cysteine protease
MFSVRRSMFDVFQVSPMKTPPFLLGATLLFWGWQADLIIPGAIMAVVLEGSRFVKLRWDLSDTDFARIWHFCALLFLAAVVYAFAENGGPQGVGRFFENPNLASERDAALANAHTAASLIRWLPMIFILFVAAQTYSSAEKVPLHAISLFLQWRRRQAKRRGQPLPPVREVDLTYPYFAVCLLAAGVHQNENNVYFWCLSALLAWALWLLRPRRFGVVIWVSALALAILFGYSGAHGIGLVQRYFDSFDVQWVTQWLGRNRTDPFRSQTHIGQIGRIKTSTRIVIRLEPKSGLPPTYLREASYRTYRFETWHADGYRNEFVQIQHTLTNENTWSLLPGKTNTSQIGIACYLPGEEKQTHNPEGLLPLPSGSLRLENLPAYGLRSNSLGAVLAEGPGLVQFDALYGPGRTIDAPPETNAPAQSDLDPTNAPSAIAEQAALGRYRMKTSWPAEPLDLQVPTNEAPALKEVAARLALKGQPCDQALQTISEFFATNFTYRTWQDADFHPNNSQTALSRFLLKTHAGHCEYFATATVLLLREIGIPARYAVGYSVHEAAGDGYIVRQRDAHAWCLVWNDQKKIWEDFDTTPGSWFEVESQHGAASVWLSDVWWWAHFQFAKLRWGQTHLRDYILAALVPVLVLLLFQIIRQRRRRNRGKDVAGGQTITWPGLDSEFYRIEKQLAQRGVPRGPDEALTDWLERAAAEPALLELRSTLRALLRLHYRYRFDPQGLTDADRDELRRKAGECLDKLAQLELGKDAALAASPPA